jgi:hypothetical protein
MRAHGKKRDSGDGGVPAQNSGPLTVDMDNGPGGEKPLPIYESLTL